MEVAEGATLVVDPGSWSFKCGVGGDDKPRVHVPSAVAQRERTWRVGRAQLGEYDPEAHVKDAVVRGRVADWDALKSLVTFSQEALGVQDRLAGLRYLVVEGHAVQGEDREKLSELLFEELQAGALFASNSAPLNLYACARSSGMVLDVGGDTSSASVVVDGFLHKDSVQTSPLAGKLLTQTLLSRLEKDDPPVSVRARFQFRRVDRDGKAQVTPVDAPCQTSFARFWRLDVAEQMLHEVMRVPDVSPELLRKRRASAKGSKEEAEAEAEAEASMPAAPSHYALPDGTEITAAAQLGREMGELLFDPKPLGRDMPGLVDLVVKSAQTIANTESRRDLLANVVLCGGPSVAWGLPNRVAGELAVRSRGVKSRVIVSGPEERQINAWLGGSILSTLSSLNDLWVSRQDYEEYGKQALSRKCP